MPKTPSGILSRSGVILIILAAALVTALVHILIHKRLGSDPGADIDMAAVRARLSLSPEEFAWIKAHPVIRARIGNWPPFMIAEGKPDGICVAYLDLVSQTTGLSFSYVLEKDLPWLETLKAVEDRRIDLIPLLQASPERERYMLFTNVYQTLPWVIVTRQDEPFVGGLEDLAGKTVSVQKGYIVDQILQRDYPEIRLLPTEGQPPALAALMDVSTGKAQATVAALPVAAYLIPRHGLTNLRIAAPARIEDMRQVMGARKDWPELVAILNKVFAAIGGKNMAAINRAWISPRYDYDVFHKTALGWALAAALVALALILGFAGINRALKKQVAERTRELDRQLEERKAAELALQESERRFRELVEYSPFPMALETATGKLLYVNRRFTESFGYALEDFPDLETGFQRCYPDPAYRAGVAARWRASAQKAKEEGGPVLGGEVNFTCKDGMVKPLDITGMPMGDKLVTVLVDLTERKKAEELMVQTEKMLSLGGLAAGMAHEINNPLGIILAAAQNVQRRLSPDIARNVSAAEALGLDFAAMSAYMRERCVFDYLDAIREAGARAARIVRNMLDFGRQGEPGRSLCSVNVLLDKTLELAVNDYDLKKNYDFRSIEIVRRYDPEIVPVQVAETEIEQVFLNVLKNAAQAMAEGKKPAERGRIALRTARENGWVRVEIEDNGPGMSDEQRKRAFDPFFTTKAPGKGTGLGLSVSYFIIVRNHGGEIRMDAAPGGGTRCVIRLPEGDRAASGDSPGDRPRDEDARNQEEPA